MKLANIASLDPKITDTGRSGLKGATSLDRRIWDAFHADWTALVSEVEEFLNENESGLPKENLKDSSEAVWPRQYKGPSTSLSLAETRLGQQFFRRAVLANFESKCCVTGIAEPVLLNASHIVPWRTGISHRHNPANRFCFSATFDRAFDTGLMTITQNLCVRIANSLLDHRDNVTRNYFRNSMAEKLISRSDFSRIVNLSNTIIPIYFRINADAIQFTYRHLNTYLSTF